MARKYQPGKRNPYREDKVSDARHAWVRTYQGEAVIYYTEEPPNNPLEGKEYLPRVLLVLNHPNRRGDWKVQLDQLTYPELIAFREMLEYACALAEPQVKARDEHAKRAFEEGDDSNIRVYRAIPTVVVRKGTGPEYAEKLQERPPGVFEGSRFKWTPPGGIRNGSNNLLEYLERGGPPEDSKQETDDFAAIREVRRMATHPGGIPSPEGSPGDSTSSTGGDRGCGEDVSSRDHDATEGTSSPLWLGGLPGQ